MILDELVLRNIGTFAGRQKISLAPEPGKPIVLVGGLNGAGKTTLLEAIHLALYGPLAQPSGRRSGGYDNYLAGLIHHGVSPSEGASIELAFRAYQQGKERQYRVTRVWRRVGTSIKERLDVDVDGNLDGALTSTWSEHVETFLPRGIAGLFFFDGEQIEALADLDRSRQVLASALDALLGLDLVQRLTTDLSVLRRRHRAQQIPENLQGEVEERRQAATALRQQQETASALVAEARGDVGRSQKTLLELTEHYRSAGGELLDQHEAAETRRAMLGDELARTEDALRDEMSGAAPLLQIPSLLAGLAAQSRIEAGAARDRIVADVVATRDKAILDHLRKASVPKDALTALGNFLAADREQRQASADVPDITGLTGPGIVEFLTGKSLPETQERIRGLIDRRHSIQSEVEDADRLLAAIPNPESLAPLREEREAAAAEMLKAQSDLARAEDQLASASHERARADAALESAMDRLAHATLAVHDDRRLVEHIDRVRSTLENLRGAAARRHLTRIGDLVLEALGQLLRKESLVTGITIDPDSHTVELSGPGGRRLPAQELSAGERQLLAVALLWGLARAAGQPLPVMIDTPLGRLDGSHRGHLLNRYFPHASHQVILLSTDTEIDESAYKELRPHVGQAYRLEFDTATSATTVQRGYFWE